MVTHRVHPRIKPIHIPSQQGRQGGLRRSSKASGPYGVLYDHCRLLGGRFQEALHRFAVWDLRVGCGIIPPQSELPIHLNKILQKPEYKKLLSLNLGNFV